MPSISDLLTSVLHFFTGYYFQEALSSDSLTSRQMKTIVVLGGACGSITTAHRIFHGTAKGSTIPFKIIIVAPNTELYWNLASPRGAVGVYGENKLFTPIAAGFKQYGDKFEFVLGKAEILDPDTKTVTLADRRTLAYDWLILATGSSLKEPLPFKCLGSTEATKQALQAFVVKVRKAKVIVVAGAGPTGIEFSAEVASAFPDKKLHLISAGPALSPESIPKVQKAAMTGLTKLGIDIKLSTKVISTSRTSTGQNEVVCSDGGKILADLYVPTFGVVPNSSYIPRELLTATGYVIVDEYLKVKGVKDVWAIGDVADVEWAQWIYMNNQATHVAKNIVAALNERSPTPYKPGNDANLFLTFFKVRVELHTYAIILGIMGFSMGPKNAAGAFGSFKLPTVALSWGRKELYTPNVRATVDGSFIAMGFRYMMK
ncbi:hypothetical protein LTR86_011222 [Recurvomyces mirabilis]|nr:hypothetical protein LTR86_011222 [Recurvomyces mirabilis]